MMDIDCFEFMSFDAHHPGFTDEGCVGKLSFDFFGKAFPEPMRWSDNMIESEPVEPKAEPVGCSVDDMVLCLWVVKVEFRDVSNAEETEVIIWPIGEIEPVVILTILVVLCLCEERMVS